jgi:hypothetical protein
VIAYSAGKRVDAVQIKPPHQGGHSDLQLRQQSALIYSWVEHNGLLPGQVHIQAYHWWPLLVQWQCQQAVDCFRHTE